MPKVKRMQDAFLAESDDLTNGMSRFCFKVSKKLKSYWGKHVLKAPPSKRICKVNTIILRRNYLSRESFVAKFVSSFFPSNPVGPASQLALQVCLHVWKQDAVSIIFRFSRPLTQTTMVFWASKSLFLASMSRQMAPGIKHIHDQLSLCCLSRLPNIAKLQYIQTFSERSSWDGRSSCMMQVGMGFWSSRRSNHVTGWRWQGKFCWS